MSQHNPATEQEWMTQVLNIHGTPFEHLCEHYLRQAPDWAFRSSRYPVEFPPSYTPQASLTKNGELDLWGSCLPPGLKIELLVECKKNNPDYTDWVFFPARYPHPPSLRTLEYRSSQEVGGQCGDYRCSISNSAGNPSAATPGKTQSGSTSKRKSSANAFLAPRVSATHCDDRQPVDVPVSCRES